MFVFVLHYVYKEKMITIEIEDKRHNSLEVYILLLKYSEKLEMFVW